MSRRRRIHDDPAICSFHDPAPDFQEGHQLVHSRQGKFHETVDIFLVQEGSPEGDFPKALPVFLLEVVEIGLCVQFQDLQIGGRLGPGETVLKGMGGIGGNEEQGSLRMTEGELQRRCSRGRSFPHTALAAKQQELDVYIGQKIRFFCWMRSTR